MENKDVETALESRIYHFGTKVEPRAMKDEQGREYYLFELSNEEIDSHRSIFRMKGGKIEEFNNDPIVTYGHPWFDSTDPDDVIGTGPAYFENGKLMARYYPEMGETNEKAVKVKSKLDQNIIKSASIVAYIDDYHVGRSDKGEHEGILYFDDWSLLMWGIVMKGSNPKAKKRSEEKLAYFRSLCDDAEKPAEKIQEEQKPDENTKRELEMLSILAENQIRIAKARLKIGDSVAK